MDSYSNSKKSKKQSYIISDVINCIVTQVYRIAKELGMQVVNVIYFTLFNYQFKRMHEPRKQSWVQTTDSPKLLCNS